MKKVFKGGETNCNGQSLWLLFWQESPSHLERQWIICSREITEHRFINYVNGCEVSH